MVEEAELPRMMELDEWAAAGEARADLYLVGTIKCEALSATSRVKSTFVIVVDVSIPQPRSPAKYV